MMSLLFTFYVYVYVYVFSPEFLEAFFLAPLTVFRHNLLAYCRRCYCVQGRTVNDAMLTMG